jgi:hypothetical protein
VRTGAESSAPCRAGLQLPTSLANLPAPRFNCSRVQLAAGCVTMAMVIDVRATSFQNGLLERPTICKVVI